MATYSNAAATLNFVSTNTESSSLFEPDIIMPSHYLSNEKGTSRDGERRLMAAILSDGIEAYILQASSNSVSSRRSKNKFDANEWIETSDDSYVFSFDSVCKSLGINPSYLRYGLRRYLKAVKDEGSVWKKIRRPRKRS